MGDDITKYVLNDKNCLITVEFIEGVIARYGVRHKVNNLALFQEAMTHKSYLRRDPETTRLQKLQHYNVKDREITPIEDPSVAIPLQTRSYDRLEFLGDAIIHKILTEYLMERYTDKDEGFLTKLRSKMENCESLSNLSKALGLNKYILISNLIESYDGRETQQSILEDAFEAFVGALHIDSKDINENTPKEFMLGIIEKEIDISKLLYYDNNYKDTLLQYYHQKRWDDPKYKLLDQAGPDHKRFFVMAVFDHEGNIVGKGKGASKRKGEQEAAREALIFFQQLSNDTESESEIMSCDSSIYNSDSDSDGYDEGGTEDSDVDVKRC